MGSKNEKLPTSPRGRDRKPRKSFYENAELKNGIFSEINQLRKLHQVPRVDFKSRY